MSGGVDSSVSAWLLKQQGYHVEGLFMKNWEDDDKENYCSSKIDLYYINKICDSLGLVLHTVNFTSEYWDKVFKLFLYEYKMGRTPNPDILCNKEIKFKEFINFAENFLDANYIATGHYVRTLLDKDSKINLLRGIDNNKDQSYFLYTISNKKLRKCLFPVGNLYKKEVRSIAAKIGLLTAKKKDSTGICFIGERKFSEFIRNYLNYNTGDIVDFEGNKIGEHNGIMYYTIGQRKGLRIGGISKNNKDPWYVVGKDIKKNKIIVAQGKNNQKLMSIGLIANSIYWINRENLNLSLQCTVKTRYRQPDIKCKIEKIKNDCLLVTFEEPVAAVTPGQSAVFYIGDRCIGGGIIEYSIPL